MNARLTLKLTDIDGTPFFGPGVAELFSLIEKTGSVRHAAEEMNLSYSKAWKMIRGTERAIGKEAVIRIQGGKGGGMAQLTESGKHLLKSFRALENDVGNYLQTVKGNYLEKN